MQRLVLPCTLRYCTRLSSIVAKRWIHYKPPIALTVTILVWCKERKIQMTGPALGRPPKNQEKKRESRKQEYQDICDRNIVEGEFGVSKRSYGLNRIMAHLPETSFCVIGIALLCMKLAKRLRSLLHHFFVMCFAPINWEPKPNFQMVAE